MFFIGFGTLLLLYGCNLHQTQTLVVSSYYTKRPLFIKSQSLSQLRGTFAKSVGFTRYSIKTPEESPHSYYKSDHYNRLRSYFTAQEQEIDDAEYNIHKNEHVYQIENTGLFAPLSLDFESLAAVPELFHENFLLRGEDHWETLIRIRELCSLKNTVGQTRQLISDKRSDLANVFRDSSESDKTCLRDSNISLRNELRELNSQYASIVNELELLRQKLPNILSSQVPENENVVKKDLSRNFTSTNSTKLTHYEIIERLNHDYIQKAVGISGKGFAACGGNLSRLARALINLFLDTHTQLFNYTEITVPFIASESTFKSTTHLPFFEEDLFKLDSRHQFDGETGYLIPTSEVPLLALHQNLRIHPKNLPLRFVSYSECFRSEIQDYGLDTRGLIRQHQFGKVELISIGEAADSEHIHELMLSHIEHVLNLLELPHRQVILSAKETGHSSSKTIDFEVYFPSLDKFIEVSSCSNTGDYQTSRLNLFGASKEKLHAINGSGLPIGRTLSALLETHCSIRDNGLLQINIPKALQPYLNNETVILEDIP
ncbi:seryl-tRNA synthetase, putative [Theileria equi strain WA]|uniref:serine--tRNA ligase n=1 Tax=Theileria equi strain WA TaxID=1537102 RepID=L0AY27_THEEQ|nr:seryl-tRNA synthetase, putative [Theileria equi strain WA]AFZ80460.1 seryl-tRNA synthetase, putative [Theileria equi strain WA]|eukprot:XP_004830126.1 seryl-tRNA synthetase, putative [Theileria equi strain WA]